MRMQYKPIIIFSVDQASSSMATNSLSRRIVERDMAMLGIQFEKVLGVYKGSEEFSYIVDAKYHELIRGMAKTFNQESILTRDNENKAYLEYLVDGSTQFLGSLLAVPQEIALASDAYTYSKRSDTYFMTVK